MPVMPVMHRFRIQDFVVS